MVKEYMYRYWEKYPDEIEDDPTIDEILSYDGKTYVGKYFLIQYTDEDYGYIIDFLCFDGEGYSTREIRKMCVEHKKFIRSLDRKIYIRCLKNLFNRDFICKYDDKLNLWEMV